MATANVGRNAPVSHSITRREAIGGAASIAAASVAVAAPAALAGEHPDAHLFALWEDYKAAVNVREPFREAVMTVRFDDPRCREIEDADDEAIRVCWRILDKIMEADARTMDGLRLKLRAVEIEAETGISDGDDIGLDSLVRSVEAMGGRFDA